MNTRRIVEEICEAHVQKESQLDASIAQLESSLAAKDGEIARLRDDLKAQHDWYASALAASYERGAREFAEWCVDEQHWDAIQALARFLASRGTAAVGEGKKEE